MPDGLTRALARLVPQVTYRFKAYPAHGQTLHQLAETLRDLGNPILHEDEEEGWILCSQFSEASDSWGCAVCLQDGKVCLLDSEDELRAHLDITHPGYMIDEEGTPHVFQ
jgi:hypothetical protein